MNEDLILNDFDDLRFLALDLVLIVEAVQQGIPWTFSEEETASIIRETRLLLKRYEEPEKLKR